MKHWFQVQQLDVERLLAEWRWLCPQSLSLLARNMFGDLFLRDASGQIFRLQIDIGKFDKVADSEDQFFELVQTEQKSEEWFATIDERTAASKGLAPSAEQCIAFSIPTVLAAKTDRPNPPYVGNIYEVVSSLGSVNRQISDLPDGAEVKLRVEPEPSSD